MRMHIPDLARDRGSQVLCSFLHSPRDRVRQMLRFLLCSPNPSRLWLQLFPWRVHSFSHTHTCTRTFNHTPHPACLANSLLTFEFWATACWVMLPPWRRPTSFYFLRKADIWEKFSFSKGRFCSHMAKFQDVILLKERAYKLLAFISSMCCPRRGCFVTVLQS